MLNTINNLCSCLLQTSCGNVFVGTELGVQMYDREHDCLKTIPMTDSNGETYQPSVLCLTRRTNDEVIASTYNYGVFHLADGVFIRSDSE